MAQIITATCRHLSSTWDLDSPRLDITHHRHFPG